jgi:hypothetical protein
MAEGNGNTKAVVRSRPINTELVLSESEKKVIKETWTRLQKPTADQMAITAPTSPDATIADQEAAYAAAVSRQLDEIGVEIFLRIFEIAPETRDAFPMFRRISERSMLVSNVVFRCHARRFVRAVQSVVDNIDLLDMVARPNLELLGRRHRDFTGFKPSYLRAFETAMEDVWRHQLGRRRFGPTSRRAWRKVFKMITSNVLAGYVDDGGHDGGSNTNSVDPCCKSSSSVTAGPEGDITTVTHVSNVVCTRTGTAVGEKCPVLSQNTGCHRVNGVAELTELTRDLTVSDT